MTLQNDSNDSLELAIQLAIQGISPRSLVNINYSEIKAKLLKEIRVSLNVSIIDEIIHVLLTNALDAQLSTIELRQLKEYLKNNHAVISNKIERVIGKKINNNQMHKLINLFIELMPLFNNMYFDPTLDSKNIVWNSKRYSSVKTKLGLLFKRNLTKLEFHFIAETWFHYMSIVTDLICQDNRSNEQVKELRIRLSEMSSSLEKKIFITKEFINELPLLKRKSNLNINIYRKLLEKDQTELQFLQSEYKRLQQGNGQELNVFKLKEQAYFAVLFCAEILGLSPPKLKKEGNPLLIFLKILLELDKSHKDIAAIQNDLSQIYQKYTKHKKKYFEIINPLLTLLGGAQNPSILREINKKFQSTLLPLAIKPNTSLINKDS